MEGNRVLFERIKFDNVNDLIVSKQKISVSKKMYQFYRLRCIIVPETEMEIVSDHFKFVTHVRSFHFAKFEINERNKSYKILDKRSAF